MAPDGSPGTPLAEARSLLFVPADDRRKLDRALRSSADALIVDLEDAVAPDRKAAARDNAAALLRERGAWEGAGDGPAITVRINAPATAHGRADLAALEGLGAGLVVPKADPAALAALGDDGPPLIALAETAAAILAAASLAMPPRVVRLQLGAADLALELGLRRRADGAELLHARSQLVLASAAAGLGGPIDAVYEDVRDGDGLALEAELAVALGMRAKACIHPRQIDVVNAALTPTAEQVRWAQAVVAAAADAGPDAGVTALDGRMIDLPVLRQAERTLAQARRWNAG